VPTPPSSSIENSSASSSLLASLAVRDILKAVLSELAPLEEVGEARAAASASSSMLSIATKPSSAYTQAGMERQGRVSAKRTGSDAA
jgi:hypothetical protein